MTDSNETKEPKTDENPHVVALVELCGPVESSTFREPATSCCPC